MGNIRRSTTVKLSLNNLAQFQFFSNLHLYRTHFFLILKNGMGKIIRIIFFFFLRNDQSFI